MHRPKVRTVRGFRSLQTVLWSPRWRGEPKEKCETVDVRAEFGVDTTAKAILAYVLVKDESVGVRFGLGPRADRLQIRRSTRTPNCYAAASGKCTLGIDGTLYFYLSSELDVVYLGIAGYYLSDPSEPIPSRVGTGK